MYYANTSLGKVKAQRGLTGTCPSCGGEVVPKCGEVNVHHWAHKSIDECDAWSEGETDWHLKWKAWFPPECTEVTQVKNEQKHRADVRLSTGWVLEFQHSPITPESIRARNMFWGKVIWIFHVAEGANPFNFEVKSFEGYDSFVWRHSRRSLGQLNFFVLDFGATVFMVKKAYHEESPMRGWGYYVNKYYFLMDILKLEREWANTGVPKYFDWHTLAWSNPD